MSISVIVTIEVNLLLYVKCNCKIQKFGEIIGKIFYAL